MYCLLESGDFVTMSKLSMKLKHIVKEKKCAGF